jgi:hypothetical protein
MFPGAMVPISNIIAIVLVKKERVMKQKGKSQSWYEKSDHEKERVTFCSTLIGVPIIKSSSPGQCHIDRVVKIKTMDGRGEKVREGEGKKKVRLGLR